MSASHWRVGFHTAARALHLVMQTKADLDVWVEFAQRVVAMRIRLDQESGAREFARADAGGDREEETMQMSANGH